MARRKTGIVGAMLALTRIEHSIMLVVAVVTAEILAGMLPTYQILALSLITPIFISMGSFAINDYYDVESDRSNKRMDRPIVNGSISNGAAMNVALACFAIGIAASALINAYAFAIALVFAALAYLYSYRMKDIALLGNVYIAFSMMVPFIYGSYVVSPMIGAPIVFISAVIFLAGLAREIHGMVRDYSGDSKARKTRNVIYHMGSRRASQAAFVLYVEAIAISAYMFFFVAPFAYNIVYAAPIAVTDIALAYIASGFMLGKESKRFYGMSRNLSLAAMGLALLAFLAAAILYVHV